MQLLARGISARTCRCRTTPLRSEADIDKEFNDGATLLLVASQHGHADVAQLVCEARAGIDKEFNDVATPLLVASQHGHADVAQLLCGARADIDKESNDGATPLLMASQHGHADVAQLLCGARTDIDKEFNDGATPLLVASQPSQTKQRASSEVPTECNLSHHQLQDQELQCEIQMNTR